jgi:hypothetical protein
VLHMVKGDYAIFNMAQPNREQAVERVHKVRALMDMHSWRTRADVPSMRTLPDGKAHTCNASTEEQGSQSDR